MDTLWNLSILALIGLLSMDRLAGQNASEWIAPDWSDTLINPYAYRTDQMEEARGNFVLYCSPCHGYEGKGDGAAGVGLPVKPRDFTLSNVMAQTDGALFWKLNTGRGNMVPYEILLPEEVRWQLITYIRFLGQKQSE